MNNYQKNTVIIYLSALVFLTALFCSCVPRGVELNKTYYPEIPQGCYPQKWEGISIYDTSRSNYEKIGYFRRIEPVTGINSPDDEWQLSFLSENAAIMTFSESGLNKPLLVRRLNEKRFSVDKGINGLPDGHNGAFSISGKRTAFTNSPMTSKNISKQHGDYLLAQISDVIGRSRIYTTELKNGIVDDSGIAEIQGIEQMDWCGQPALSANGNIIVFSSDKAGGYGGTDLWFIYLDSKGKWSVPINLGNNINSKCDEITPNFSKDGKRLYFSSAGHSTVGGYDIFYSEVSPKFRIDYSTFLDNSDISQYFSKPVNIGTPINTMSDELFPSTSSDFDEIIYYSSNQNSKSTSLVATEGGFDLYVCYKVALAKPDEFVKKENKIETDAKLNLNDKRKFEPILKDVTVKGRVFSKSKSNPIDSAIISINSDLDDSKERKIISDKQGKFEFPLSRNSQFEVTAQKKEYFYDSKRIFISAEYSQDTMDMNFYLPEIGEIRLNFPTDEFKNPYRYTLDSSGTETGRQWTEELKLVAANIKLALDKIDKIVLVGHTDDVGTDEYNTGLGQRRVDFVVSELIKLGIPQNIVVTRSAGEHEPIQRYLGEDIAKYRKRLRRVTMEKFFK